MEWEVVVEVERTGGRGGKKWKWKILRQQVEEMYWKAASGREVGSSIWMFCS